MRASGHQSRTVHAAGDFALLDQHNPGVIEVGRTLGAHSTVGAMGKTFEAIDNKLKTWIEAQPVWFVGTSPLQSDGHVNVSPRGHDSLSVLGDHRIAWVDYTGSGVETIAHIRENGRVCVMFSSFGSRPRIVRLHGQGSVSMPGEAQFDAVVARHPSNPSTRAVITVDVTRISDSCGWGVPIMEQTGERDLIRQHADKKGTEGMVRYRKQKNGSSIDGLSGLPEEVSSR